MLLFSVFLSCPCVRPMTVTSLFWTTHGRAVSGKNHFLLGPEVRSDGPSYMPCHSPVTPLSLLLEATVVPTHIPWSVGCQRPNRKWATGDKGGAIRYIRFCFVITSGYKTILHNAALYLRNLEKVVFIPILPMKKVSCRGVNNLPSDI